MKKTHFSMINARTQEKLVENLWVADTFFSRFLGLMGSDALQENQGLLISPCQQIHTHFMGYTVDVIFLDKHYKVVHIAPAMKPWKFTKFIKNAYFVLELAENRGKNIQIDDTLTLQKP